MSVKVTPEDLQRNVDDLAMLVAQLARALRRAAPEHELPARATDYLRREGLCGSPLRASPNIVPLVDFK